MGEENKKTEDNTLNRREFLKLSAAGVAGAAVGAVVEYPVMNQQIQKGIAEIATLNNQISQLNNKVTQADNQITSLQQELVGTETFLILNVDEINLLEAVVETIIPGDSSDPGAKEAGVIYFIDKQLATDYGKSANMYMKGPFIMPGLSGSITVDGITYPQGTPSVPYQGGTRFQYPMQMREIWRLGLAALQSYSNSVYSSNFEDLTNTQKVQILTDLYNDKPTSFNDIKPTDFFGELIFMTWSGFFMDPIYGGNRNMVGWKHTGFNGTNRGNFYNEGYDVKSLMVSDKPVRLQPASLGQWQKSIGLGGM